MAEERVSYSDISNSCNSLTNIATSLSGTIDNINSAISQITDPTWDVTAATSYVEKLRSLCNHLPDANRQLAEAVLFLASCADGYKAIDEASVAKLKEIIGGQEYINQYDVNAAPDIDLNYRVSLDQKQESTDNGDINSGEKRNSSNTSGGNTSSGGGNYFSGGGSYSGGGGGYSGGGYSGGGYSGGAATIAAGTTAAASTVQAREDSVTKAEDKEPLKKGEKIQLPDTLQQGDYKINEYDDKNDFKKDSDEAKLEELWKKQGSNYNDKGLATIEVDNEDRYLVKVSPKYGKVGDSIDVSLKDGSVVKCVIAENKTIEGNQIYGTEGSDGKVNIIEFEAKTGTKTVEVDWNKDSKISNIKNNGNVITEEAKATTSLSSKTYPPMKSTTSTSTTSTSTSGTTTTDTTGTTTTSGTTTENTGTADANTSGTTEG